MNISESSKNFYKEDLLKILCLNAFIRPPGIMCGNVFGDGDYKDLRLNLLIEKIHSYDIVLLQEIFEIGKKRQSILVKAAYDAGLKYHAGSVWPKLLSQRFIDGGLLILSRFPITSRDKIIFKQGSGADGVCSKGVLYAEIQMSPCLNGAIHVFTTHTQAGEGEKEFNIRQTQLLELVSFVKRKIQSNPNLPVILGGDFNLDALHNYTHENGSIQMTSCLESDSYIWLEKLLEKTCNGYEVKNMIKYYSEYKGKHIVTNGQGHGRLYAKEKYANEKSAIEQCIDYLFLFIPSSSSKSSLQVKPVDRGTAVDKCLINDSSLPITQLSDHYAITSLLSFKTTLSAEWGIDSGNRLKFLMHCFPPLSFQQRQALGLNRKKDLVMLGAVSIIGAACIILYYILLPI